MDNIYIYTYGVRYTIRRISCLKFFVIDQSVWNENLIGEESARMMAPSFVIMTSSSSGATHAAVVGAGPLCGWFIDSPELLQQYLREVVQNRDK